MSRIPYTKNWKEIVDDWNDEKIVWSASLGGIGPGYEQCIQDILFTLLSKYPSDKIGEGKDGYKKFQEWSNDIITKMDEKYGFSGAQVGAAQATAYQFIKYGYSEMMNKLDDDRHIQVCKNEMLHRGTI